MGPVADRMSSAERIRAVCRREPTDHLPLCFEGVGHGYTQFVHRRFADPLARADFYLSLGVDTAVMVDMPIRSNHGIEMRQWSETPPGEAHPVLIKEYATDAGSLRQAVRQTDDYPHADIPLFSDHHVPPARSVRRLVSGADDLDALQRILQPPADDELDEYRRRIDRARRFCDERGCLLTGTLWGVGDVLIWLSGVEPVLIMALEQPDVLGRYVEIVAAWDAARLQIQLDAGVDLIVRRGWYESTDFWSPQLFADFLAPPLAAEVQRAHQAGAIYTYVMNSGAAPLLEQFAEIGFDIYSNIDPMASNTDLAAIKRTVGGSLTLYGGVNNNLIIERGSADDVRQATAAAVETLGPDGFILGPGDSILSTSEQTQRNFDVMIDTWKRLRR